MNAMRMHRLGARPAREPSYIGYVHLETPHMVAHVLEMGRRTACAAAAGGGATAALWVRCLARFTAHSAFLRPTGTEVASAARSTTATSRFGSTAWILCVPFSTRWAAAGNAGGQLHGWLLQPGLALEHPERVERLVLIGAPTGPIGGFRPRSGYCDPGVEQAAVQYGASPSPKTTRDGLEQLGVNHGERLASEDLECAVPLLAAARSCLEWLSMLERSFTPLSDTAQRPLLTRRVRPACSDAVHLGRSGRICATVERSRRGGDDDRRASEVIQDARSLCLAG